MSGTSLSSRVVVTVDGIDGSGKSMLASRLCAALGPRAVLLRIDDFRRPVDFQAAGRSELDIYYDDRYDLGALEICLQRFCAGAPGCEYQAFDGPSETLGERRTVDFAAIDHVIVEGVFVARLPSSRGAFSVYVEISRAESRRRLLDRDVRKGRTPEEVTRRMEQRYFPAHERYDAAERPRERAQCVIDNSDVHAPRFLRAPWIGAGRAPTHLIERALHELAGG